MKYRSTKTLYHARLHSFELKLFSLVSACTFITVSSSETQGQLVGAGKSLNGREKNSGEEKSRTARRAPSDKVLTDQFQTAAVVLASDWCHKTFVFFVPNQRAARLGVVSCLLTPQVSHHKFTRGGKFQSQRKM